MRLPSIVTNINGSREIVENGKNGIIIPSKDIDALVEAMIRVVVDKEFRENLANEARQMIASRFEQSFVRKCMVDFYESLI